MTDQPRVSAPLRVLTYNVLTHRSADGPARHRAAKAVLRGLAADVVALQEVTRDDELDQALDLLGPDYTVLDVPGGDPVWGGECLATRGPVLGSETLDVELPGSTHHRAQALAIEVEGPSDIGPVLVVHHKGTFELDLEQVREQQVLATAALVTELVAGRPGLPVVLLGDFNAGPEAASLRFLTGRQSLAGVSVRYEDAWEAVHGDDPGHTFEPRNPLVRDGQMPLERGRRLDHILVRSGAHGALLDVTSCRRVLTEPIDGTWASDHYGVLAELAPPAHPPGTWARPVPR